MTAREEILIRVIRKQYDTLEVLFNIIAKNPNILDSYDKVNLVNSQKIIKLATEEMSKFLQIDSTEYELKELLTNVN